MILGGKRFRFRTFVMIILILIRVVTAVWEKELLEWSDK